MQETNAKTTLLNNFCIQLDWQGLDKKGRKATLCTMENVFYSRLDLILASQISFLSGWETPGNLGDRAYRRLGLRWGGTSSVTTKKTVLLVKKQYSNTTETTKQKLGIQIKQTGQQ